MRPGARGLQKWDGGVLGTRTGKYQGPDGSGCMGGDLNRGAWKSEEQGPRIGTGFPRAENWETRGFFEPRHGALWSCVLAS